MIGKQYIVEVTDKGIVPLGEFNRDRFVDMDCDDLDVLTDAEKKHVINDVLSKIKREIEELDFYGVDRSKGDVIPCVNYYDIMTIIKRHRE